MEPKDKTIPEDDLFEQDVQTFFKKNNQRWEVGEKGIAPLLKIPEKHPHPALWNRWLLWLFPALASISVLFVLNRTQQKPDPIFVPKGDLWQVLYAHGNEHSDQSILTYELKDHAVLYPGDLVQFTYQTKQATYVMIVGMNQKGIVYPLVMSADKKSLFIQPGKGAFPQNKGIARSFRLDQYIGKERFFIVRSRKALTFQSVQESLRKAWTKAGKNLSHVTKIPAPWSIMTVFFTKQPYRHGEATHNEH